MEAALKRSQFSATSPVSGTVAMSDAECLIWPVARLGLSMINCGPVT